MGREVELFLKGSSIEGSELVDQKAHRVSMKR